MLHSYIHPNGYIKNWSKNRGISNAKAVFASTRMHSSRMRTGRSFTVCRSLLPEGGCLLRGVCSWGGCLLVGGVCSRGGCLLLGGVCSGGRCLLPGGCLLSGGCLLPRGVSALGGWHPSMHWGRHSPCEQNDRQVKKYYLGHNFVAAGKYSRDCVIHGTHLFSRWNFKTTSMHSSRMRTARFFT